MLSFLKRILWVCTLFGFLGLWRPFKVNYVQQIIDTDITVIRYATDDSSAAKYLKADCKKVASILKKHHLSSSKKLPNSYKDFLYTKYSRQIKRLETPKERGWKSFYGELIDMRGIYIPLVGFTIDDLKTLNSQLRSSTIQGWQVFYGDHILPQYLDRVADVRVDLEECDTDIWDDGENICGDTQITWQGDCINCGKNRLSLKDANKFLTKVANPAIKAAEARQKAA